MAAFCLFGRSLPIHFSLLGRKRKEIKSKTTAKLLQTRTSIAAVRDKIRKIDTFLTPLLSGCRLPLSHLGHLRPVKVKRGLETMKADLTAVCGSLHSPGFCEGPAPELRINSANFLNFRSRLHNTSHETANLKRITFYWKPRTKAHT
jgi:hypothetical protein